MNNNNTQNHTNGKGDKPRNCFSRKFKDNYDEINWGRKENKNEKNNLIDKNEQINQ